MLANHSPDDIISEITNKQPSKQAAGIMVKTQYGIVKIRYFATAKNPVELFTKTFIFSKVSATKTSTAKTPKENKNGPQNLAAIYLKIICLSLLKYCFKEANIKMEEVDYIATSWNPGVYFTKFNPIFSGQRRHMVEQLYSVPDNLIKESLKVIQ